jgi:hypothetical protein
MQTEAGVSALQTDCAMKAAPNRRLLPKLAFVFAALGVACYLQLRFPGVPDRDAFYHLRHASLYVIWGPFLKTFSWAGYSVIGRFSADNWYGFHLLLTPFSFLSDPRWAIKGAGIFLITLLLCCFRAAAGRMKLALPWLWPFVLLLAGPTELWRLLMTRPHVLTLSLTVLLFAFLLQDRHLLAGLASLGIAFFHLSFCWVAPLLALVILLAKAIGERTWESRSIGAVVLGGLLGGLLRPNPWGAAKLLYVQIIQLSQVKAAGLPLLFGIELYPMTPRELGWNLVPLLLWLGGAGLLLGALLRKKVLPAAYRRLLFSGFLLSTLFFEMTLWVSRRAMDFWLLFAVFFLGGIYTVFLRERRGAHDSAGLTLRRRRGMVIVGGLLLLFGGLFTLQKNAEIMTYMPSPYRLAGVGEWLRRQAPPGAVVFNPHWDDFPELFYWAPQNRYIGGLDPIFQYAYSPSLYWKVHHLAVREDPAFTCGEEECTARNREDTYRVLKRDFRSSYILLNKTRDAGLFDYVKRDPRFAVKYQDAEFAVAALEK